MNKFFKQLLIIGVLMAAAVMMVSAQSSVNMAELYSSGRYLYKSNGSGEVQIYDILNEANPELKSTTTINSTIRSMAVANGYLYLATDDGVTIYDITNINSPALVTSFHLLTPAGAGGIAVKENYLLVTDFYIGLMIYDISDLTNITKVNELAINGFSGEVGLKGNYAFIAETQFGGVNIVDVTNPLALSMVGSADVRWPAIQDIEVCNNYLLVSSSYFYNHYQSVVLEIFDIGNMVQPVLAQSFERTTSEFLGITAFPGLNKAYVGTSGGTIDVISFSAPQNISIVDTLTVPGHINSVAGASSYIYAVPTQDSLTVIRR